MLIPYTLVPNDSDPGNQKTTIVAMANDTRIMIVHIPVRRRRSSGELETACPELGTALDNFFTR